MKPSNYAILPAEVRYDDQLTPNAKLLYAELTALANKEGYAWATNQHFAKLYKVSKRTITRWLTELENKAYVKTEFDAEKKKRIIKIQATKMSTTPGQKRPTPLDKNVHPLYNNNKYFNNKFNIEEKEEQNAEIYTTALQHINQLFTPNLQPKTYQQKNEWRRIIKTLDQEQGISSRLTYFLCKQARADKFWKKHFFSIRRLVNTNNEGIPYYKIFLNLYRNDILETFQDKELQRIK